MTGQWSDMDELLVRVARIEADYARLLTTCADAGGESVEDLTPAQHSTAAELLDELAGLADQLAALVRAKADFHREHQWPNTEGS